MSILFVLKGLVPSNDLQQAVADMFSEGVYDLENEIIRAIVHPNQEQQVVYLQILHGVWPLQILHTYILTYRIPKRKATVAALVSSHHGN